LLLAEHLLYCLDVLRGTLYREDTPIFSVNISF